MGYFTGELGEVYILGSDMDNKKWRHESRINLMGSQMVKKVLH